MRAFVMVGVVVATGLGMWGCGSGYGNGSSGSPSSPTPPTAPDLVTVNVVGITVRCPSHRIRQRCRPAK